MHKININLHNLKTALIFGMEFREIIRLDMVYVCAKLYNFLALLGRDPRGGGGVCGMHPRLWDGVRPGFFRVKLKNSYTLHQMLYYDIKPPSNLFWTAVIPWISSEPEGHYCCTKSNVTLIAPIWFSTEHICTVLVPFWFSAADISLLSNCSVEVKDFQLKGKFSSGIEGALASTLNRDFN